ncbi:hypothetical protein QWZ10_03060 [Paracoccus cavernae]|uniref:Uncharacterized protein n=1 Tax=Paracoccus cavernae TaxID=1571207 RepID=A0ABT8D6M0_9RHOB|nr:hypothetical protein [Paracoccus cavernae]
MRGHRRDRRTERHGGHLDVGPELLGRAESRGRVDALTVDHGHHRQHRAGNHDHLDAHRKALADQLPQDMRARDQELQIRSGQAQRQLAGIDRAEHCTEADVVCHHHRQRRARDSHLRKRADPEDEERVQNDIEHYGHCHEDQRRHRIAAAAQGHHQHGLDHHRGHGDEGHAQEIIGERQNFGRCPEQREDLWREDPADRRDDDRSRRECPHGGADDLTCRAQVVPAHRLADQDGRGQSEAEDEGRHQHHDQNAVGGCGKRLLAQKPPDPNRVDRAVGGLQNRGAEGRKGEKQKRPVDGGGG